MTTVQASQEPRSAELYNVASRYIPGGVNSNSRFRRPHPRYFERAEGAYIYDVDGNRYLDCIMGNGAVILGHGHERINEAIKENLTTGLSAGVETELAVRAAEAVANMFPTPIQVRFTNTGTEAAMHCLRIARAVTGRPLVAKIEGSYHGWSDAMFISTWPDLSKAGPRQRPVPLPGTAGIAPGSLENIVILPFNDIEATREILAEVGDQIAAVILEPVLIDIGYVPAEPEYLRALRELTEQHGILLIFDELLTGFRLARGGAQEAYGVTPDLSMLGKAISNGMPIAAVAGKEEILKVIGPDGPVAFNGTFNAHQVSLAAVIATMQELADGTVIRNLEAAGQQLADRFHEACNKFGVAAQFMTGGGHFNPYFTSEKITDYRSAATTDPEAYRVFQQHLASEGIHFYQSPLLHHALSAAHDQAALEQLAGSMERALQKVAEAKQSTRG